MSFAEIYRQQHIIYQRINDVLQAIKPENPIPDFTEDDQRLKDLQTQHVALTLELLQDKKQTIWLPEIPLNLAVFSEKFRTALPGNYVKFFTEQYRFFIEHLLDVSQIAPIDAHNLYSLILQIMTTSSGLALICKLNQQQQTNAKFKITVTFDEQKSLCVDLPKTAIPRTGKCLDVIPMPTGTDKQAYRVYKEKGTPADEVILNYPKNWHEQSFMLTMALPFTKTMSMQPKFIAIAHELLHVLHLAHGKHRRFIKPRDDTSSLPAWAYGFNSILSAKVEELFTIEFSKLGENAMRKEHKLLERIGIFGAYFPDAPKLREKMQEALGSHHI